MNRSNSRVGCTLLGREGRAVSRAIGRTASRTTSRAIGRAVASHTTYLQAQWSGSGGQMWVGSGRGRALESASVRLVGVRARVGAGRAGRRGGHACKLACRAPFNRDHLSTCQNTRAPSKSEGMERLMGLAQARGRLSTECSCAQGAEGMEGGQGLGGGWAGRTPAALRVHVIVGF